MTFIVILTAVAALAGGIAAIAGFGVGSLLTPLLALRLGTKLAVAVVSVPHFIGSAARFAGLWRRELKRVSGQRRPIIRTTHQGGLSKERRRTG
jgi:uncharacterized membrane protein YfcA